MAAPDYESVCGKKTGHAEVVCVSFDSAQISAEKILEVFFTIHDPTTPNRQGNDVGPQYRSVVFATSAAQESLVREMISALSAQKLWDDPIVTEVFCVSEAQWTGASAEVSRTFWPAEAYHQNYFQQNPSQGYCVFVVNPKVIKAETRFPKLMR
ncbi:MAG: hypothetical protein RLZZ344_564 [Pseudomonadota bacterium]